MSSSNAKRLTAVLLAMVTCMSTTCAPKHVIIIGDSIMATREINRAFDKNGFYVANLSSGGQQVANSWGLAEAANNIFAGNIIITLGYNDYAQELPTKNFRNAYLGLLTRLKQSGDYLSYANSYGDRKVFCINIFPNNIGQDARLEAYRSTIRAVCPNLIDYKLFEGLDLKDDVHPTPEGSEFIVNKIASFLEKEG